MNITISETRNINRDDILKLYKANKWSDFQGQGIGQLLLEKMQQIYGHFHMQMLTADGKAVDFYKKNGFERAGKTEPMWIYKGNEH
ncbi:hypothetical protein BWD42_21695 [Sphingobacterium sp. CZ-UAM]|uniref:GNAT family N-acetyltransferase n=1 Tax=Sphingobacterium sp. CZ-UAM TaxID=1933868 RepID=UPI0009867518|nr:GNAT family N-acetyltransferase [Sphingobacterium sp. CZ-UAM]OOG16352.1 hypothetical protein BWD42_21695 [Sphingobacterium sp. CZ-UAM]